MKRLAYLWIVLFSIPSLAVQAQEKTTFAIKGNLNFHIQQKVVFNSSLSVLMQRRMWGADLELTQLSLKDNVYLLNVNGTSSAPDLTEMREFNMGLMPDYKRYLMSTTRYFSPYIGIGENILFTALSQSPFVSNVYPQNSSAFSFSTCLIPGLQGRISKKFFYDLSVPISFIQVYWERLQVGNPGLSLNEQISYHSSFNAGPLRTTLKAGLGYRI